MGFIGTWKDIDDMIKCKHDRARMPSHRPLGKSPLNRGWKKNDNPSGLLPTTRYFQKYNKARNTLPCLGF